MKYALFLFGLALAATAFAVSPEEIRLQQCLENCCEGSGGSWTGGGECLGGNSNGYDQCSVGCIQEAFGVSSGASCCGPAVMLAGLAAFAVLRK
jgi:hypothetical protein